MQNHTALLPRLDQHMTKLHTVADTCRYKLHHTAEHCNPAFGVCFTHRQHTHGRRRMCQPHRRATAELSQRTQLLTCPHRTQQQTQLPRRGSTQKPVHTGPYPQRMLGHTVTRWLPRSSDSAQISAQWPHSSASEGITPWLSGIAHRLPGQHSHREEWTNHTGDISCHTEHFSIHTVSCCHLLLPMASRHC